MCIVSGSKIKFKLKFDMILYGSDVSYLIKRRLLVLHCFRVYESL